LYLSFLLLFFRIIFLFFFFIFAFLARVFLELTLGDCAKVAHIHFLYLFIILFINIGRLIGRRQRRQADQSALLQGSPESKVLPRLV
jgi:membrane protein implicated in regulation of membrane protease activity